MMKKDFMEPEAEIILFAVNDVICSSPNGDEDGGIDLPIV